MNYTEEDVRNAFKAGLTKGNHKSYFDAPLDEDEYLTELKQVKNNIVLADVSGQLPSFLYEDIGEVIVGVHGDTVVTDDWNKWKEGNLR